MRIPDKVITPVKTGVQDFFKFFKFLDSGFRMTKNGFCRLFTRLSISTGRARL